MPPNCTLTTTKMVNFMLRVFYYSENKSKRKIIAPLTLPQATSQKLGFRQAGGARKNAFCSQIPSTSKAMVRATLESEAPSVTLSEDEGACEK